MTTEQALKMAKAKLECIVRETSCKAELCNNECESCHLNYEQGNMGEQKEWLKMAIKALENQCSSKGVDCEDCPANEPCEDVMAIYTQGLDEGIRCAMCTNSLKSDRGCDGGCVVNKDMYKEVMNTIKNHIVPPTSSKMEQVEDAISRKAVLEWIKGSLEQYANTYSNDMLNMWMLFEEQIKAMSPITPIQPKAKVGYWETFEVRQSGLKETWYQCSICKWENALLLPRKYCPNCGAKMEVDNG